MFRFMRFVLFLCLTLAGTILVMCCVGSMRSLPSAALWETMFTNPDGSACQKPCMFGVRPGITTRREGLTILRVHPALIPVGSQTFSDVSGHFVIEMNVDRDTGIVQDVSIERRSNSDGLSIAIGQVSEIHNPQFVVVFERTVKFTPHTFVNLYYPESDMITYSIYPAEGAIKPDDDVSYLRVLAGPLDSYAVLDNCKIDKCQPWQGYASFHHYLQP